MSKKICIITSVQRTIKSFFESQINYLADKGFEITVICSDSIILREVLNEKVRCIPVSIPRGTSFFRTLGAIVKLCKIFKKENYTIIQYSTPNAGFCASIAARITGCKIRNYHLMGFRYLGANGIGRFVLKLIEKITCNNSTSIECVSTSNLNLGIAERIFPASKATVVWNGSTGGVDLTRFDSNKREQWRNEIRKEIGYSDSDFVYGFVGRITRDKGINELLEAFMTLKDDSKLFLIGNIEGEKSLNTDLLNQVRTNSRIKFHSSVRDIERYYAALDVLILPSYREGFGNVIIEAGAMGTPAIVSDIPGPIDTILKDKTALVVPVKNCVALADAMRTIRNMDYVSMGEHAVHFVKMNFDSEVLNEKILERKLSLFEELK